MRYHVTIDFKRGPSFGLDVVARSEQDAIEQAKKWAPQYGFDQPVKKAKAVPV